MVGLVPAIQVLFYATAKKDVDARHEARHDKDESHRELQA
jgi:hypothetical protein